MAALRPLDRDALQRLDVAPIILGEEGRGVGVEGVVGDGVAQARHQVLEQLQIVPAHQRAAQHLAGARQMELR